MELPRWYHWGKQQLEGGGNNLNYVPTTLYETSEYYIKRFIRTIELMNQGRPCNGKYKDERYDTNGDYIQPLNEEEVEDWEIFQSPEEYNIAKEIKNLLKKMKDNLFPEDEQWAANNGNGCLHRNCIANFQTQPVVSYADWKRNNVG